MVIWSGTLVCGLIGTEGKKRLYISPEELKMVGNLYSSAVETIFGEKGMKRALIANGDFMEKEKENCEMRLLEGKLFQVGEEKNFQPNEWMCKYLSFSI